MCAPSGFITGRGYRERRRGWTARASTRSRREARCRCPAAQETRCSPPPLWFHSRGDLVLFSERRPTTRSDEAASRNAMTALAVARVEHWRLSLCNCSPNLSVRRVPSVSCRAPMSSLGAIHATRDGVRTPAAERCRRRFLRFFPNGFNDETYLAWERNYKAEAAGTWRSMLARPRFEALLTAHRFSEIASAVIRIEARTNLLFSFEKMAFRDATRTPAGARRFSEGLYAFLHGQGTAEARFAQWIATVAALPRRQTRVLTWPIVTVCGFIAQPTRHIFLKPNVTRIAAARYGFPFHYASRPNWKTYRGLLKFASLVRADVRDLRPRDLIDIQSFLWVQGSEEYSGRSFRAAHTTRVQP